jgi:diguanylate cyclase (GGDEF)-like protein/PAS domain S-box-containing protein
LLLHNAMDVIAVVGADGKVRYISPAVKQMLGYAPEEVVGKKALDFVNPADYERVLQMFIEASDVKGLSPPIGVRVCHRDGTWRRLQALYKNLLANPEVRGILVNITEATERKWPEEVLRGSEERFRLLVEHTSDIISILEPDGTIRYVSPSIEWVLGYTPEEMVGKSGVEHVHPEDASRILDALSEAQESLGLRPSAEVRARHKDSTWRYLEMSFTSLLDNPGVRGIVSSSRDITERKEVEERLKHRAFHDLLTDLPNRQLFTDRLRQALRRTRRRQSRRVAVLFMDLDNFKIINDSLGHQLGDRLLVAIAERLQSGLRPEDTLARFGGDEFTILIEDVERPDDAAKVAERILEVLNEPFVLDDRELFVRVSIGIALGSSAKLPADLLRDADTAMYRAKEEGVSYQMFESSMHQRAVGRLELENDLRRALEQDEFVVYYQPVIDLKLGGTWGFEALLRWRYPMRGLLDPSQFMLVAEESGLIIPICERVLQEACQRAKEWQEMNILTSPVRMAVNLSARQLWRPELREVVEGILNRSGFEAGRLSLDVTEAVYLRTIESGTATLDRLRALGVRISIDDFGTAYSTLSSLKHLSADALKIDKRSIRGSGEEAVDRVIVQMVIDLAHTLDMKVIAEGVESEGQAEQLKEMGCDLAQGFYFSEPLPPEVVPEFLAR